MFLMYVFTRMVIAMIAAAAAMLALSALACLVALAVAVVIPAALIAGTRRVHELRKGARHA